MSIITEQPNYTDLSFSEKIIAQEVSLAERDKKIADLEQKLLSYEQEREKVERKKAIKLARENRFGYLDQGHFEEFNRGAARSSNVFGVSDCCRLEIEEVIYIAINYSKLSDWYVGTKAKDWYVDKETVKGFLDR
jgi:hypothetical protein